MKDLKLILKQLREEKGLSQKEVAAELGLTRPAYANYEQGIREPSNQILVKLSNLFEVPVGYLLGVEDDFGAKITPVPLPDDQQELNILFQSLAPGYRAQVLEYARYMAERSGVNLKNTKKRG